MPKHPIYTVLLSAEAQAVLGKVHPETAPALRFLEQERFRYQGYIDIFAGGPVFEAPLHAIRSVRRSLLITATIADQSISVTFLLLLAIAHLDIGTASCRESWGQDV